MEQDQNKPKVNADPISTSPSNPVQTKPKKNHCLLIALISGFVFVVLMFFVILPFILTRLDAYMSIVASSVSTKTPSIVATPKTKATKKATTSANYEVTPCEQVQTSNPEPLNISTDNPVLKQESSDAYYQIYGLVLNDITRQLGSCGPKYEGESFAGMTTDYINWAYLMRFDASGNCRVDNAAVGVNVRIYYPKWDAPEGASSSTKERWDNMISNLRVHEEGHRQIDYDGGAKIFSNISSISASSCNEVESKVTSETRSILDEVSQSNINYDAQTNHGETQGAHF